MYNENKRSFKGGETKILKGKNAWVIIVHLMSH